ncbi:vgr related protein [Blastomonas sp.]|uniref:vgr related protein n=1 Tax=Blastomonas sp. TaxID=1909299 RepID=UPI003592EB23
MIDRPLCKAEVDLARSVFGNTIAYDQVRIRRRKWIFFQPRKVVMAPLGHIHFHPGGSAYCDDFSCASPSRQGLFIHEMVHVWQHQSGIFLPLKRHPFCRYDYSIKPGQAFGKYGLEQQAELVRHAFLLRQGHNVPGAPPLATYRQILPFPV